MNCEICQKIAEKKDIAYEDNDIAVLIEPKPCIPGHIKIFPKKHVSSIRDISKDDAVKLFKSASSASTIAFEALHAQGTNILCNEGIEEHLCIHVIPRKMEDSIGLKWTPKQLPPQEFSGAMERLKDKAFFIGKEKPEKPKAVEEKEIEQFIDEEEDYMLMHVRRIP